MKNETPCDFIKVSPIFLYWIQNKTNFLPEDYPF